MALITSPEELQRYLPSSVYDDTESLLVLTERAERKHLVPVLGDDLMTFITKCIPFVIGDRVPGSLDVIPNDAKVIDRLGKLASLCQSAVAYFTVADNAGQLSLSFNQGNGLAQVNTDGYTAASEDSLKRFLSDVWHQAKQDVDDICYMLEKMSRDAPATTQSSNVTDYKLLNVLLKVKNYWKSSEWFFFQGDLLLTNARDTRRYVTDQELPFSYAEYVKLQGELRTRQEACIAPELGQSLLEALVRFQYEDDLVFTNPTPSNKEHINRTLHLLRLSLMSFVRFSKTDKPKHENDARLFLFRAIEHMQQSQSAYSPFIEASPIYIAPSSVSGTTSAGATAPSAASSLSHPSYGDSDDGIFNPFGV